MPSICTDHKLMSHIQTYIYIISIFDWFITKFTHAGHHLFALSDQWENGEQKEPMLFITYNFPLVFNSHVGAQKLD